MNESIVHRALASPSRTEILRVLYRKPLSVEQIAEKLNLQTITIRHHLQALMEAGIVECHEEHSGAAGRPRAYYSVVKAPQPTTFPRRQYQSLAELLIFAMVKEVGANKTKASLKKIGNEMGESLVKKIESDHNIKSWSPKEYERYIVNGYFEEEGSEPEVVEASGKKLVYRLHNCLFHELAVKMPEIMCDILHDSLHEGISRAIGKDLKISRSTCMGHGAAFCEHTTVWAREGKKPQD